jgi:hypothetical protein
MYTRNVRPEMVEAAQLQLRVPTFGVIADD